MFRNPYLMLRLRRWWWRLPLWVRDTAYMGFACFVAYASAIILGWLAAQGI